MDELFSDAAARLAEHPKLGTLGKIPGTRELIPHESYRLVYEIDDETVWKKGVKKGSLFINIGSAKIINEQACPLFPTFSNLPILTAGMPCYIGPTICWVRDSIRRNP